MTPDIGLVADAALSELDVKAKQVERVAMKMNRGPERDELVWIAESMRTAHDLGRKRIAEITRGK